MRQRMCVLFASITLLLGVYSTAAQDVTQEPEPTLEPTPGVTPTAEPVLNPVIPPDVVSPGDAGVISLTAILSIVAAFANGLLTATIVSLLKLFLPTDATVLKNVVGGGLTILWWLAVRYNFEGMFESAGQFFVTVVPALVTLLGGLRLAPAIHEDAVAHNFPLLSYQRTP